MRKVAIVIDSIACLTKEMVEQYRIGTVPISIYFGDRTYKDWLEITPSQAYEFFLKDPERFKTSPASPGYYLEAYRGVSKQTDKDVLCITLSSKLSTRYEMDCVAREQAKSELPQVSIEVLDSQSVTAAEGFIALAAARAADEGKGLDDVVKVAEEMRNRTTFIILLDTIRHVYRIGRIPKVAARIGSMLGIKPILTMSDGLVRFVSTVRNRKRSIDRIVKMLRDRVGQKPVHVAVMHAYAPDDAEMLKERKASEFNCVELWITEFNPVTGYACGTGTVGFTFYSED